MKLGLYDDSIDTNSTHLIDSIWGSSEESKESIVSEETDELRDRRQDDQVLERRKGIVQSIVPYLAGFSDGGRIIEIETRVDYVTLCVTEIDEKN